MHTTAGWSGPVRSCPVRSGSLARSLTRRLVAEALAHLALVLQVDVPALGLAGRVLQREGEDGVAQLQGLLAVRLARGQDAVDGVEGGRGRELVCERWVLARAAFTGSADVADH